MSLFSSWLLKTGSFWVPKSINMPSSILEPLVLLNDVVGMSTKTDRHYEKPAVPKKHRDNGIGGRPRRRRLPLKVSSCPSSFSASHAEDGSHRFAVDVLPALTNLPQPSQSLNVEHAFMSGCQTSGQRANASKTVCDSVCSVCGSGDDPDKKELDGFCETVTKHHKTIILHLYNSRIF